MGRDGFVETIRLRITPTANRNSYRVARLVGVLTQGSVLRPQPWAGETQLRQSCCCLRICCHGFCCDCNGGLWVNKSITPTANRNSYRVARLVGALTQGSVLRPQPWAGETQLRQSCCCLKPLPMPSPRGGSPFLLCLRWLCGALSPWGELERGFGGAPEGLQRGFESSYTLLYIYTRAMSRWSL